jgi:hypothetical protein
MEHPNTEISKRAVAVLACLCKYGIIVGGGRGERERGERGEEGEGERGREREAREEKREEIESGGRRERRERGDRGEGGDMTWMQSNTYFSSFRQLLFLSLFTLSHTLPSILFPILFFSLSSPIKTTS